MFNTYNLIIFLCFSRCFNSKYGQAAIYVEAIEADSVIKRTATIDYDLQPLPRGARGYDPTEGELSHISLRL